MPLGMLLFVFTAFHLSESIEQGWCCWWQHKLTAELELCYLDCWLIIL